MKKTPSHFMAHVEIERQISFFSFDFTCVTEVRHIVLVLTSTSKVFLNMFANNCHFCYRFNEFVLLLLTRMHSSRMRTTRLLPVSPSMHCSGGVYLVPGVCTWSRGVYLVPGGYQVPWGYLPRYPPP